jgi:cytoskeletal protein CcmA (bactofilin family)
MTEAAIPSGAMRNGNTAAPRPSAGQAPGLESTAVIVAAGARFEGLLSFRGGYAIEGDFRGEVAATGRLVLAEGSHVSGRIEADEVIVAGSFEGDIIARTRLELLATARVTGNFTSPTLAAADGCQMKGGCRTGLSGTGAKHSPSSS